MVAPSPDPVTASDVVSWLAADADGREPPGAPRKNKRAGKPNWMKRGGRKHKALVAARKAHGAQHDDEYYGQVAEFDDEASPYSAQLALSFPDSAQTSGSDTGSVWFMQPARELPPLQDPRLIKHLPAQYNHPLPLSVRVESGLSRQPSRDPFI